MAITIQKPTKDKKNRYGYGFIRLEICSSLGKNM